MNEEFDAKDETMTDEAPFPVKTKTSLGQDAVVRYLLDQQRRGYQVVQSAESDAIFELVLDDANHITFNCSTVGKVQVKAYRLNNLAQYFDCTSLVELQQAVEHGAQILVGQRWRAGPTTGRIKYGASATNQATISGLIARASVVAVFDPYLENRSLATLTQILSFGDGAIAEGVRILSTAKTTRSQIPRLTRAGFESWLQELGVSGELRIMPDSEHRRFLLLDNGRSLILGPSLNSIHKNEAVRLEPDVEDRAFFEAVWAQAEEMK